MTVFGENGRIEQKGKGCDIGYVLATGSCEKPIAWKHAPSQPLDAITAFAVPNPNCTSQRRRFFQVWLPSGLPRYADHSVYFGPANFILPALSTVDGSNLNRALVNVNANFWCTDWSQSCA